MPDTPKAGALLWRAVGAAVWAHRPDRLPVALIALGHPTAIPAGFDALLGAPGAWRVAFATGAIDSGDQRLLPPNGSLDDAICHTRINFHGKLLGDPATCNRVTLRLWSLGCGGEAEIWLTGGMGP